MSLKLYSMLGLHYTSHNCVVETKQAQVKQLEKAEDYEVEHEIEWFLFKQMCLISCRLKKVTTH